MNSIHPISQTSDTVTLRRADFEMMLDIIDDAEDIVALRSAEAREIEVGKTVAREDHLPVELVLRLLAGEHPIRVWREHRQLTTAALAEKAGISRSYITEIETGQKPGSITAFRALAKALNVTVDDLLHEQA